MVISKPRGVKSTFDTSAATSQKPGPTPGLFHGAKESLLSLQATEKRTCCKANTGFWLDSPLGVSSNYADSPLGVHLSCQ